MTTSRNRQYFSLFPAFSLWLELCLSVSHYNQTPFIFQSLFSIFAEVSILIVGIFPKHKTIADITKYRGASTKVVP
jgi:hypothetical protein